MANAQQNSEELPRAWQRAFNRMRRKADDYLRDPQKARTLVERAQAKAAHKSGRSGPLAGVSASLGTMGRLVRAYAKREYRHIPWSALVAAGAALLYFVTPLDAVPDILLGFGLIDDAAILAFVATRLSDELNRFEVWERDRRASRLREAAESAEDAPIAPGQDAEPLMPPEDQAEALQETEEKPDSPSAG